MNKTVKRVLILAGAVVGTLVICAAVYVGFQVNRYESSMGTVYAVPVPQLVPATDPGVLARGKHLAESIGGCTGGDCHGRDLSGGKTLDVGPVGTITGPNITPGGLGAVYSEGELFRLIRHGVKKDGRSVRFMPSHEIGWLPDADLIALVSYLGTVPAVNKPNGPIQFGLLGKLLDRHDLFVLDVARRIDHKGPSIAGAPTPDATYGRFLALGCVGCHGSGFAGGPIPGAPPDFPTPSNITPDSSGIGDWSYADFTRLLDTGIRKNGTKLHPFMPLESLRNFDETERQALWAYLRALPAKPFGDR